MKNNVRATSKSLYHSGSVDGDYVLINPRQVWRSLKAHRRFILLCMLSTMSLSQIFIFFYKKPQYFSEVRVKLQNQKSITASAIVEQFSGIKDQNTLRANVVADYFESTEFMTKLLLSYIKHKYPFDAIVEDDVLRSRYVSMLKGLNDPEKRSLIIESEDWQALVKDFSSHLSITVLSSKTNSNLLTINVHMDTPVLASKLSNLAAIVLLEHNMLMLKEKSKQLKQFVRDQAEEKKNELVALEEKLVRLQKAYRMPSSEEFVRGQYSIFNKNVELLDESDRKVKITDKMLAETAAELKRVKRAFMSEGSITSDLYMSQLQHRINILQYQKAVSGPTPDVTEELDKLVSQYQSVVDNRGKDTNLAVVSIGEYTNLLEKSYVELKRKQQELALEKLALKKSVDDRSENLDGLPDILRKFERLKRQTMLVSELYVNLQRKYQEVEMMDAGIVNDLQIISRGITPKSPDGLSVNLRYAMAGFIGLLLSFFLIMIKNLLIQTIGNFKELEEEGITVIGEVPLVPHLGRPSLTPIERNIDQFLRRAEGLLPRVSKFIPNLRLIKSAPAERNKKEDSELIVFNAPHSPEADIFRFMRLRMNSFVATYVRKDHRATVCLVTSPTERNGKTFVSANLAATFAKGDIKTLLIDLDLRNPSIKRLFPEIKSFSGAERLFNGRPLEENIVNIAKNLDVLFCAESAKTPTEILESKELRAFIQRQREKYHYIFLDTPPALAVCDPSLIAPFSDVVIMVAGFQVTFRDDLLLAIDGLNSGKRLPILGVLNFVHQNDKYSYYYYSGDGPPKIA